MADVLIGADLGTSGLELVALDPAGTALPAGQGVGLDVDPDRDAGRLVEPCGDPALQRALARWSAA